MSSSEKIAHLKNLCTDNGVIAALAIDQRGALRRMMGEGVSEQAMSEFKVVVSEKLTAHASAILLDPEVGIPAAKVRDANCGLILAYEKTGYDKTVAGRYPDLIDDVSVYRLKEYGADGIKLLIYYDCDQEAAVNDRKKAFVERVGSECKAEGLPFFLEILTYDENISEAKEYAKVKAHKVNTAMKVFSDARYAVDVLKVEVPVDIKFVEGFAQGEVVTSTADAKQAFVDQANSTHLPFIFLSAGVSTELFFQTLKFAKEAGSTFNGVLCGRATWANGVAVYQEAGVEAANQWMDTQGKQNITELQDLCIALSTPIKF